MTMSKINSGIFLTSGLMDDGVSNQEGNRNSAVLAISIAILQQVNSFEKKEITWDTDDGRDH